MDRNQEILEISKLVFDLTMVGSAGSDLDDLLARLFDLLDGIPAIRALSKGAILLFNPRKALVQVAQHGDIPAANVSTAVAAVLDGVAPDFRSAAYVTRLSAERALYQGEADERFVVLPLVDDEGRVGQVLIFIEPDWELNPVELEFMTDLGRALSGLVMRCLINEMLRVRELELEDARTDAIRRLGAASEYRDNETGMHVMRMTHFAVAIAKALGLPAEQRELLAITAPMHDVGKIGIADAILLKPERLTPGEYDVMKTHTHIGGRILQGDDPLIAAARDIALMHHEQWDGSGYPAGLKGEEIPILARVCALADVFDALTSHRPYKEPWPLPKAIEHIRSEEGKQFDPEVVGAFLRAMPEIQRIRELYRDDIIDPNQIVELPEVKAVPGRWVAWGDSLRIGIDVIDAHHRFLVDLVNDLHDVVISKRGAREVGRVLKALETYAKVHFRAEERMMAHYGFGGLERQQHQHHHFEKSLRQFHRELHANPLTAPRDMLTFLRDWLVQHIRHEDAGLRALVAAPAAG
ncbi:MAG: bacteriohemerythrin [Sulfurisoma sp.]|nr:bacteriohemerythrin [Sulfurisoma sp.]